MSEPFLILHDNGENNSGHILLSEVENGTFHAGQLVRFRDHVTRSWLVGKFLMRVVGYHRGFFDGNICLCLYVLGTSTDHYYWIREGVLEAVEK